MLGTWRRSSFRTWTPVRCSSFTVTAGSLGRRMTLILQGSFQSPTKTKPHLKVSLHAKDTPPYISQTQKVSVSPTYLFQTRILSILPYQGVKRILVPQPIYSKWNNGDILLMVLVWQWCCLLYDFNMTIMTSCLWFWCDNDDVFFIFTEWQWWHFVLELCLLYNASCDNYYLVVMVSATLMTPCLWF